MIARPVKWRLLLAGSLLGAFAAPAGAQDVSTLVRAAADRLEEARADRLFLLAPRSFERAATSVESARRALEAGGAPGEAENAARDAQAALAEAERTATSTRPLLRPVIEARDRAVAAGAPDVVAREWTRAEEQALDAGRRAERGDEQGAAERIPRAVSAYNEAEIQAIRVDVLGRVAGLRDEARKADAAKRAPRTLALADTLLAEAETVIRDRPGDLARARELAESSAAGYRHAVILSALADSLDRKRVPAEDLLLRREDQLARVAAELGFTPEFSAGFDSVIERTVEAARSLQEDRENLRSDVGTRTAEIERLNDEVDRLDARLAEVEQREAAASAQLRERERKDRRIREAQAIFGPEEAEVLAAGDRLTVRLFGLTFASGSDEIRPENFSILTKLQRVVREFPEGRVLVEGHTDTVGNDDVNRALSQRRAIAVRDWLLQNVAISSDRISAIGYGESRPIAPNDTAAGRERNRRIEVVIDASPT